MKEEKFSERKALRYQLGREPDNLDRVYCYCPFAKPAVLLTKPYHQKKGIFPTSYWLSCPYLVKEVSRLEDKGLIKELSDRLKVDREFREELMNAHQRYAAGRYSLLSENDIKMIKMKSADMLKVLKESGIGGIMDKNGIKCLHTHLADFIASNKNPVGKIVWQKLQWPKVCDICNI